MNMRDVFDSLSPVDYRYWDPEVAKYLSENAFTDYKKRVEIALVRTLFVREVCSESVVLEVEEACKQVTTEDVYEEEKTTRHDVRALVNCIARLVSDEAKPFVHMTATSYDIVDSANAARYKDVVEKVLVPALIALERVLIDIAIREADTVQVGRTHGQHAVPITFGFAIASYVSRLGISIQSLAKLADRLRGKFSGAVGAYNASSLFFDDPWLFEGEVMWKLGIHPAEHSTQIAPPEPLTRLLAEVTIASGILANIGDDMRNLQRTEIGEVGEEFGAAQVGSSTMPQKRNPINFENAKSCWKIVMPRIITVFMDQISDHQRDLTNSASSRTYGEMISYLVTTAKRLTGVMKKLKVDKKSLARNVAMERGMIVSEPLYIILAAMGHPHAHEKVRTLTLQAQREDQPLESIVTRDPEIRPYLEKMTEAQRQIFADPTLYTGVAAQHARKVAEAWKRRLFAE